MRFCPEPPFLQNILLPAEAVRAESFLILETLSWQDTHSACLYSLALTSLVEDVTLLWNPEKCYCKASSYLWADQGLFPILNNPWMLWLPKGVCIVMKHLGELLLSGCWLGRIFNIKYLFNVSEILQGSELSSSLGMGLRGSACASSKAPHVSLWEACLGAYRSMGWKARQEKSQ